MFLPSRRIRRARLSIVVATGLVALIVGRVRPAGTTAGKVMVAASVTNDDDPGFSTPTSPPSTDPPPDTPPPGSADPVLVGAGDIANCADNRGATATSALLDHLPGTVFTLGDNVYVDGTPAEFANCYNPVWG